MTLDDQRLTNLLDSGLVAEIDYLDRILAVTVLRRSDGEVIWIMHGSGEKPITTTLHFRFRVDPDDAEAVAAAHQLGKALQRESPGYTYELV